MPSAAMVESMQRAVAVLESSNLSADTIEAIGTIVVIVDNLIDQPNDPTRRRIRITNFNFKERCTDFLGAMQCLEAIGFVVDREDFEFIVLTEPSSPEFVESLRAVRTILLERKKVHEELFRVIERELPDHRWTSVRSAAMCERLGKRPSMEDDYLMIDEFAGQAKSGPLVVSFHTLILQSLSSASKRKLCRYAMINRYTSIICPHLADLIEAGAN